MTEKQEKERFFALYWGQSVVCSDKWMLSNLAMEEVQGWNREQLKDAYLELKPLSAITDEDAIEVDKLTKTPYGYFYSIAKIHWFGEDEEVVADNYNHKEISIAIDFLRSHGYALPWLGISVEEQINRRWVKLIES